MSISKFPIPVSSHGPRKNASQLVDNLWAKAWWLIDFDIFVFFSLRVDLQVQLKKIFFFGYAENNLLKVVGTKLRSEIKGSSILAARES